MGAGFKPDWYTQDRNVIVDLQAALDLVCPNEGVSIGRWHDRSTWRVDFRPEATDQQKAAAAEVIATFKLQDAMEDFGAPRVLI